MPAIRTLGILWHLSTDDMPIPAVMGATYLCTWFALVISAITLWQDGCSDPGMDVNSEFMSYIYTMSGILGVNMIAHLVIVWSSTRGSPLQESKRRYVVPLMHIILLLYIALLGVNIWGTVLIKTDKGLCPHEDMHYISAERALVYGSWAAIGVAFLSMLVLYNIVPRRENIDSWVRRINCYLCITCSMNPKVKLTRHSNLMASEKQLTALEQLAHTLHSQFGQDDLTLSDYFLGLSLLGTWQRLDKAERRDAANGVKKAVSVHIVGDGESAYAVLDSGEGGEQLPGPTCPRTPDPSSDALHLCEPSFLQAALKYHRHATAVYGWVMHSWVNRGGDCCAVCCGRGCGCLCAPHPNDLFIPSSGFTTMKMDFSRRMSREAILNMTGISDEDLLLINDENKFEGVLPFYIAADRGAKEVILSVRGTWTISDTITDLMWEPCAMSEMSDGRAAEGQSHEPMSAPIEQQSSSFTRGSQASSSASPFLCHGGMYRCAQDIYGKALPTLQALLGKASNSGIGPKCAPDSTTQRGVSKRVAEQTSCVGYKLVLTGHSLGAGVATLLGVLLRRHFPDLVVWAIAPPGGLLSPEAAKVTESFVTSVVFGKDMMPRMTLFNITRARDDILQLLALCRPNKLRVQLGYMFGGPWKREELFNSGIKDEEVKQRLSGYMNNIKEYASRHAGPAYKNEMVPPGRTIYIQDHKVPFYMERAGVGCGASSKTFSAPSPECEPAGYERQYIAHWVGADVVSGLGMLVSKNMFWDHTPDRQLGILEQVLKGSSQEVAG